MLGTVLLASLFGSCASRKDLVYFLPDSTELHTSYELNAPKLQPGDRLFIMVSADDIRATEPFNQINVYTTRPLGNDPISRPLYAIDLDGNVDFPKLGKVRLAGLTRVQAIEKMQQQLSKYIEGPTVNLQVTNFQVTVLGEVRSPGTFTINNDRITLLEALGRAGDLTINGVRHNVKVIREENGQKQEYHVDLTKRDALNSPVYYLAQNDVVYVEPNGARRQSSRYTQNTSVFVSFASVIVSVIAVLSR